MTDTVASQNIDLSSWETLYKWSRAVIHRGVTARGGAVALGARVQAAAAAAAE